ncbi:HupE/UreJ family protein [Methylomonas koyamae]|uniref:HupE/UreJ family protein n=1 Tax=Methylomonas koyamae TaxID=702114 RepID=UPI002873485E|nr:HupE/UreJ family protein [Methylomonas koyamae]WNB76212.1 HupE/UreJ family protein [Methylomonas koyamae]
MAKIREMPALAGIRVWLALALVLLSNLAAAHAPGLSSIELTLQADRVVAKMTFALQDIEAFSPMDTDLDAEVSATEREAAKPAVAKLLSEQTRVTIDGVDVQPTEPGIVNYDDQNNAHVEFNYQPAPKRQFSVQSKFLAWLQDGHQQHLTVRNAAGNQVAEKMLRRDDDQLQVNVGEPGAAEAGSGHTGSTFSDFFKLGVEHILTGYDHLLFLFALLAVTHSFWPAIKIVTFFTIAHSITLACAGLNLVDLPSSFVEPFIAATIVYVAVENLVRGDHPKGRQWLTFGFGLIHGFGFASVLRELDISSGDSGILLPLLSFNLGIEAGQITVASIVLPLIWWLNNKPYADKFLKGCSALVCLVGTYWFIERTLL